jgi:hypothetical protein
LAGRVARCPQCRTLVNLPKTNSVSGNGDATHDSSGAIKTSSDSGLSVVAPEDSSVIRPFETPSPVHASPPRNASWDSALPTSVDPWVRNSAAMDAETSPGRENAWPKLLSPPPPHSDEGWETEPPEEMSAGGILVWIVFILAVALIGAAAWNYEWILDWFS